MSSIKTLSQFTLAIFTTLIITACSGGGGGGSDNQNTAQPQHNQITNNNQPSNNNQPQKNETGGVHVLSGVENSDKVTITPKVLTTYNKTKLNVEGKEILIGDETITSKTWFIKEGDTIINGKKFTHDVSVCCGKYTDTTFGIAIGLDPSQNDYFFYNGNPTQNMPSAGKANYVGDAIIQDERFDDDIFAQSKFNVDFGNKKLSGTLTSKIEPIRIEGTISGNSFNGTAKTDAWASSKGITEGKFYGNNAKEMSGIINAEDSWGAAFGARKQ